MNGTTPMKPGMGQPVPRHPHVPPVNTQYLASTEVYNEPSRRRKSIAGTDGLHSAISHDSGLASFASSFPLNLSTGGISPSASSESSWTFRKLLPPASTIKFILLCILWYGSSALSSNTGKVILNNFRYPVTLTIVQFFFVAGYCWLLTDGAKLLGIAQVWKWLASRALSVGGGGSTTARKSSRSSAHSRTISLGIDTSGFAGSRLKKPTRAILAHTAPMAAFQVMGHIFASMAMSRIPVSTVHTIKALTPLCTVMTYALLFKVSYSPATYVSLLPLTLGVMLASSAELTISNALGLICAFGSTVVFVSQNIFFKKIMPSKGEGESAAVARATAQHSNDPTGLSTSKALSRPKLDKINLLFFSSGMAFLFMIPLWVYSDLPAIWTLWFNPEFAVNTAKPLKPGQVAPSVAYYFFLNGTVHFAQNLLAFAILSSTSPVTYSIASLIKRIAVICLAIVWFNQSVHPVQALGIGLTGIGLFMYNKAKREVDKGEKKLRRMEAIKDGMLPLNNADQRLLEDRSGATTPDYYNEKSGYASPKPEYMDDTNQGPLSSTSAFRSHFSLLPPSYPVKVGSTPQHPTQGYVVPYPSVSEALPSPPPSQASSPPSTAIPHPYQEPTSMGQISRRRPSIETATRRPAVAASRIAASHPASRAIQESPEMEAPPALPSVAKGFREITA